MGAKWQRIRSILNPRMLKPQHVSSYSNTINEVVTDFLEKLAWLRAKDGGGVMVNDMAGELYKFAFEGQMAQTHGTRCLSSPPLFYVTVLPAPGIAQHLPSAADVSMFSQARVTLTAD